MQSVKVVQTLSLAALISLGTLTYTFSVPIVKADEKDHKVVICHWDNGQGGKYTSNDVDTDSTDAQGHNDHDNDIIPIYHYDFWKKIKGDDTHFVGDYAGKNLTTENQAILANDCKSVTVSPSASPSIEPSASPSVDPSATPTPDPTATPAPTDNNNSGSGDGLSDGRSSCPECTQVPKSNGQVLGASTFAKTGVVEDAIMNALGSIGGLMTAAGSVLYGKKKTKRTL